MYKNGIGKGSDVQTIDKNMEQGEVKFTGQVLPTAKKVTYTINMKRVIKRKLFMGIADGIVSVDGRDIYAATDLKVGLFQDTSSF